jgi:hypothetical protein
MGTILNFGSNPRGLDGTGGGHVVIRHSTYCSNAGEALLSPVRLGGTSSASQCPLKDGSVVFNP